MISEAALKIAEQWAKVRMAHEATMLDDTQQLLKQNRAATSGYLQAMNGTPLPAESDGVIHIGDTIHMAQPAADKKPASAMSTLAKLAMAAALVASGAGIGAAVPLAIDALRPQQTIVDTDTDTDTVFDIVIPGGGFPPNVSAKRP